MTNRGASILNTDTFHFNADNCTDFNHIDCMYVFQIQISLYRTQISIFLHTIVFYHCLFVKSFDADSCI